MKINELFGGGAALLGAEEASPYPFRQMKSSFQASLTPSWGKPETTVLLPWKSSKTNLFRRKSSATRPASLMCGPCCKVKPKGALEIHFINMVQYRKQRKKKILDNPLCRWLAWLDASSPPGLIAEVVKMDSAIEMANERMVYVTGDKEAIRAYEMRLMGLSDYNSSMNYAREEGHAEGRNEERQYLLEMIDQGLSIEEIKRRLMQ